MGNVLLVLYHFFCLIVEILAFVCLFVFCQMLSALRRGSAFGRMPNCDGGDPGSNPAQGQIFL